MLIDPACVWQSVCSITPCVFTACSFCHVLGKCFRALGGTDSGEKGSCLWFSLQNRFQTAREGLHSIHKQHTLRRNWTTAQNQEDKWWNTECWWDFVLPFTISINDGHSQFIKINPSWASSLFLSVPIHPKMKLFSNLPNSPCWHVCFDSADTDWIFQDCLRLCAKKVL